MRLDTSSDSDPYDNYIGRCVQNWLAMTPPPPARGKERLLREASVIQLEKTSRWGFLAIIKHYILVTFEYLLGILEADLQNQSHDLAYTRSATPEFGKSLDDYMFTYTSRGAFLGVFG